MRTAANPSPTPEPTPAETAPPGEAVATLHVNGEPPVDIYQGSTPHIDRRGEIFDAEGEPWAGFTPSAEEEAAEAQQQELASALDVDASEQELQGTRHEAAQAAAGHAAASSPLPEPSAKVEHSTASHRIASHSTA